MHLTSDISPVGTPAEPAREPVSELDVRLDAGLPQAVTVGRGTALFVCGSCFSPTSRIRSLGLVVDGEPQRLMAHGMPRLDLFQALHPTLDPLATAGVDRDADSEDDPLLHSYRSGFWGVARMREATGHEHELLLRAELEDGGTATVELARPRDEPLPDALDVTAPAPASGPLVAVCMATYEPPREMLVRQIASIRAQTHPNWVCVISDDGSSPAAVAAIEDAVAGDERFVLSRSQRRLGFYRNFERALALAPAAADHVALADQDDRWHPEKLETLLGALGGARLVYSDARVTSPAGEVLADTYWSRRRNNHTSLTSLLVANAVTGAASLMPRDLLDDALPLPPPQFAHFHDHWLGLVAAATGGVAYVDRPLYDYHQHLEAVIGHAAANSMPDLASRVAGLGKDPRKRVRLWRMTYYKDNCRLAQFATVLEMRCGSRMAPRRRRELRRFWAPDPSPATLALLAARAAREMVGRPETLGAELGLLFGFLWRRLLGATALAHPIRPRRGPRLEAVPPASLAPSPGRPPPDVDGPRDLAEKVTPLNLAVGSAAPERVNLLVPDVDLKHLFGGYLAKFNLARRLAERGLRVRIVSVDPTPALPRSWTRQIEAYDGLAGLFDHVEVAFARASGGLEVNRSDRFVATTWRTAVIAAEASRRLGDGRFLYLIQEYEPFTFPMGSWAAMADESYRLPHHALFSTELLRDYFRRRGLGVYRHGREEGDAASAAFRNAITSVAPPTAAELAGRTQRRLLFYARPEEHAARNMFELGVLAIDRALARGAFAGWELQGIGSTSAGSRLSLGGGSSLRVLRRTAQADYGRILRDHDVGLSLMFTPHPSLVPIEMASAGMLTVTNAYENKTPEALAAISPNLLAAEPGVETVADALCQAAEAAGDFERRAAGARFDWPRDWDEAFDDALMDRVLELLAPQGG